MIFPAAVLHIPPVLATENIVFVSGAFRRTIFVSDLESFVKTGVPVGLLADLLKFSKQNPKTVQGMLKTELPLPVVLTSRLLVLATRNSAPPRRGIMRIAIGSGVQHGAMR